MSALERRNGVLGLHFMEEFSGGFTVLGKLTLVLFIVILAAEAPFSAKGLNADGNALLDFKNGITSDPDKYLQSWNTADATPCNWNGIICKTIQGVSEEQVVEINLSRNALGGTISPRLGDLEYLISMNLGTNRLTGQIPKELFHARLNLTLLDLSNNALSGDIPAAIRNVGQYLQVLDLSGNELTGLPEDIRYCYRLQRLLLSKNNITSVLPIGLGSNLTELQRLDLSMNRFSGPIPDDFGNLTSIKGTLNLSNNHLSGSIPQSLANLRDVFIDLRNNNLSGPIPPDSYFQSLGETAFLGNAALCGAPLKTDCAPSPSPSSANSSTAAEAHSSSKKRLSKGAVIGIAVGCGVLGLLMATLVFCFFVRKLAMAKKTLTLSRSDNGLRGFLCSWRESASEAKSGEEEDDEGDLVHLTGVLSFTLEELLRASAYVLSKSGVGIVYKAVLDEGTVVAVRRLGVAGGEQRHKEFEAEVKAIAQVRHPNIVCLHSYSWTVDEKLLIYDYLSNGSLETALHGGRSEGLKGPLSWEVRIRIARGVAQGLAHIHECSPRKQYIHGDIKPGNILLDAFLEPRIADFGLQRLLALAQPAPVTEFGSTRGDSGTRLSPTAAAAAVALPEFGRRSESPKGAAQMVAPFLVGVYQAPEATNAKRFTQKSDVYSFGVVLLELLTGRSPFKQLAGGDLDLVSWMRMALLEKRALSEMFDPFLLKTANNQQSRMIESLQVALACIAVNPESRPKMKQIAEFFDLQTSNS
ncbi:hypothetical protein M758_5G168900 [Ceratodon purpureus]|nr:hypothetical protein M758_5G168900 [Ceratodon purpureus]